MLKDMTPKQYEEWVAYNEIEPIGHDWRSDYRTALLSCTITNAIKQSLKAFGAKPGEPDNVQDHIIWWDWRHPDHPARKDKTQSVETMKSVIHGMVKTRGGKVQKRDPEKHEQLKRELGIEE